MPARVNRFLVMQMHISADIYYMKTENIFRDGAIIMDDCRTWEFPRYIGIEKVCEYEEHLKNIKKDDVVTFDLRNTVKVHSSFIGFLIHAKHHIRKNGGNLILFISLTIERILIMLNIIDHFSTEISTSVKKTA